MSKKITLSYLLLIITLLFGGCNSKETSEEKVNNYKAEIEKNEREKQKEIDKLKVDLQSQQEKAISERKSCDDMTKDIIKAKQNPEDTKFAIKAAQCRTAVNIENQVAETKKKLEAAGQEISEIQKQKNQPLLVSNEPNNTAINWLTWLFFAFIGIISLCLFGDAYLLHKKINNLFNKTVKERDRNNGSLGKLGEKIGVTNKVINNLTEAVKLQHGKIEGFQLKLREKDNNFKEMVDELIQTVRLQQGRIEELEFKIKESRGLNK